MKKALSAILALALAVSAMTGCTSGNGASSTGSTPASSAGQFRAGSRGADAEGCGD